jgi:hypothetical protein
MLFVPFEIVTPELSDQYKLYVAAPGTGAQETVTCPSPPIAVTPVGAAGFVTAAGGLLWLFPPGHPVIVNNNAAATAKPDFFMVSSKALFPEYSFRELLSTVPTTPISYRTEKCMSIEKIENGAMPFAASSI